MEEDAPPSLKRSRREDEVDGVMDGDANGGAAVNGRDVPLPAARAVPVPAALLGGRSALSSVVKLYVRAPSERRQLHPLP